MTLLNSWILSALWSRSHLTELCFSCFGSKQELTSYLSYFPVLSHTKKYSGHAKATIARPTVFLWRSGTGGQMVPVTVTEASLLISHPLYLLWPEHTISAWIITMKLHEWVRWLGFGIYICRPGWFEFRHATSNLNLLFCFQYMNLPNFSLSIITILYHCTVITV